MQKYFDLVIDLLDLEDKEELSQLASQIENLHQQGKTFAFFHRYQVLLQAWLDFLGGKLGLEEFVQFGDVDSDIGLVLGEGRTSQDFFLAYQAGKNFEQEVFVVDEKAWKIFLSPHQQEDIRSSFLSQKKHLLLK